MGRGHPRHAGCPSHTAMCPAACIIAFPARSRTCSEPTRLSPHSGAAHLPEPSPLPLSAQCTRCTRSVTWGGGKRHHGGLAAHLGTCAHRPPREAPTTLPKRRASACGAAPGGTPRTLSTDLGGEMGGQGRVARRDACRARLCSARRTPRRQVCQQAAQQRLDASLLGPQREGAAEEAVQPARKGLRLGLRRGAQPCRPCWDGGDSWRRGASHAAALRRKRRRQQRVQLGGGQPRGGGLRGLPLVAAVGDCSVLDQLRQRLQQVLRGRLVRGAPAGGGGRAGGEEMRRIAHMMHGRRISRLASPAEAATRQNRSRYRSLQLIYASRHPCCASAKEFKGQTAEHSPDGRTRQLGCRRGARSSRHRHRLVAICHPELQQHAEEGGAANGSIRLPLARRGGGAEERAGARCRGKRQRRGSVGCKETAPTAHVKMMMPASQL